MLNTHQVNQTQGNLNYLVIEYLKLVPFLDDTQKEKIIDIVRNIIIYIYSITNNLLIF